MKNILVLLFLFLLISPVFSQNIDIKDEWGDWWEDWWDVERPVLEVSYGISKINYDAFTQSFENTSLIDLKFGAASNIKRKKYKDKLSKYNFGYLAFGVHSSDLDMREKTAGYFESSMWRLGLGRKEGYMIKAGSIWILPYTTSTMMWSRLDMKQLPDSSNLYDRNRLLLFDKAVRFGSVYEGGIDFHLSNLVSVQFKIERQNVYQRHLFWKNTGSMIIEEIGHGIIDQFVKNVLKKEPIAGSIINFVLQNAYYIGIYQLRSKEMNWPFGGEASLNFDSFKFGLGFTF